ncbi:MAG TPA: VWA domain-containing protein [Acidobacteriaceae bacterium]|nr:VWA domain-containing protein [Acidobacteriaceae bacterium]
MREVVLAVLLPLLFAGQQPPSPNVPDAPAPQSGGVQDLRNTVQPGAGTGPASPTTQAADAIPPAAAPTQPKPVPQSSDPNDFPPDMLPETGKGPIATIRVPVNFVVLPVTVKDKKGQLIAGLTWRDFKVYENGERQRLSLFTVDPFPLSVAFLIDQGLPRDDMKRVNDALSVIPAAFAPSDEVAVYTYSVSPHLETDFTAATGARLPAVMERAKRSGREMGVPITSGPLAGGPSVNGHSFDPNLTPQPNGQGLNIVPKDVHALNDAILFAATDLARRERGRRRIIYVISDGKEYGSKAKTKDVIKYLQTNNISVYATVVGDSALPVFGFLDKYHLPFLEQRGNILPVYVTATGGALDAEITQKGIESSFAKITEQVRTQYTLGYISHTSSLNSKFRSSEVRVNRPNVNVDAPPGYYPSARPLTQP